MRFPRKMTVELTARCNFRCPYCYCVWHEFPKLAGPELDTDGWKDVLDRFAAAALSGASLIQLGAMMAEGRGKRHLDLMISRAEWEAVKDEIRKLPNVGVPYSFADEFICTCRDQPSELLSAWADLKAKRCPAGRSFGVVGPDGTYRICLHALPKDLMRKD